ncbi:MAG: nucleoside triphosphate pyrophosphohydrolase [Deltaproteobacteria bacterium]|nr:nucleoside triphosphate pyrophosphohydrolase [Deltaproteobacteria bacterium]MBW1978074.1 nucleoside triphosphate pyrophosphohydrolase [Deltaproteobacteria bacterium]MBW2045193.1 nucleoside triphosphate pyrophosphohydrolase [Deltaproteobacteria bacterium]MBW2301109.1 nucleoside triphosphate pyrophosphohydrolase [Deltaproteobacteria bacterium]
MSENNDVPKAFSDLVKLVSRLRGPEGCPWDAVQTYQSVKTYLLEECYEALDAIDRGVPEDICSELGDLLFQILFLASIAEEKEDFTLLQLVEEITTKMVKRHPHVFGQAKVGSAEEVVRKWEQIKKEERGRSAKSSSLLQSVPISLPALLRAHRLGERVSKLYRSGSRWEAKWERVEEEFGNLREAVSEGQKGRIAQSIGSVLFCLAQLARNYGLNAEDLLRTQTEELLRDLERPEELD